MIRVDAVNANEALWAAGFEVLDENRLAYTFFRDGDEDARELGIADTSAVIYTAIIDGNRIALYRDGKGVAIHSSPGETIAWMARETGCNFWKLRDLGRRWEKDRLGSILDEQRDPRIVRRSFR